MSFDFGMNSEQEPVDWDQFLVDEVLTEQAPYTAPESPASDSHTATPKSTESEQSQALDVTDPDPDFDSPFAIDLTAAGIMHRAEDVFQSLPPYDSTGIDVPDKSLASDPTITSTFTSNFSDFGSFTSLGGDAASQLGLTNLLEKMAPLDPTSSQLVPGDDSLNHAYTALGWAPQTVEPSALFLSPRPSLKRKNSDTSADSPSSSAKRPRRQPPKSRSGDVPPPTKRTYRRQSKPDTLASRIVTFADDGDSGPDSPRLTSTGKPSTARPKSVVPEKYLKDGSAQTILGMTVDEIQRYPTFEGLLKQVEPLKKAAAAEFGSRIAENRDKAKDAAKKSRDERRQKIESLEQTVSELEGKVEGLQGILVSLVARGLVSQAEVDAHVA